jgi:hypothetical protein
MAGRELKAHGSHPEAPDRKKSARGVEGEPRMETEGTPPEWAKELKTMMMTLMPMVGKVESIMQTVAEVKTVAQEARDEASEAKEATSMLETDVAMLKAELTKLKGTTLKHVEVGVVGAGAGSSSGGGAAVPKGYGKGGGKNEKRQEEKSRTVVFSNFANESQEEDIIRKITEYVASAKDDIDEIYTFAKTGTRGAARFTTDAAMWKYMTDNKGNHKYEHEGRRIYAKAAGGDGTEEAERREKAVRKVVRALIEREGGNGEEVKKRISAKYQWGCVWWRGVDGRWEKVAQWSRDDFKMTLMGTAASLQKVVDALLE